MGSAIGDYDGDGRLDWFVSALVDVPGGFPPHSGNRLFRNNGDRTFTDQTDAAGVRNSGWSWGTTFLDHDNDRDLDLFVTNGWDTTTSDQSHLYRNDDGVFTDISNAAGVTDTKLGRGLVSFDYDNDGDLDVYIANHGAQPILYRNDGGNENDWLKIKFQGTDSNRDGLGALHHRRSRHDDDGRRNGPRNQRRQQFPRPQRVDCALRPGSERCEHRLDYGRVAQRHRAAS